MSEIATQLRSLIEDYYPRLQLLRVDHFSEKTSPTKWSKKEMLGHLIDSAQTNIRRFLVAQYEEVPKIAYRQDDWVRMNNYQDYFTDELIDLWYLQNKQLAAILDNLTTEMLSRECMSESIHTVGWLAEDYLKHLKHHMHDILGLEPVAYP